MAEPATNKAWEILFDRLKLNSKLDDEGIVFLKATDIKKFSSREPRLMCKFDDRESRPKVLKSNKITILPVLNGEYALIRGDGYQNLPSIMESIQFLEWPFQKRLETLPKEPRSESQVIDMAFATGLISHFLEDYELTLTIRGRLRSAPFKFQFSGEGKLHELNVNGVQIEIDAGFEGDKIYLIEAKMGERDDFHIRQLYYPMRMWLEEGVTKEIVPIFITYANEIISISKYRFTSQEKYSSIELVKTVNYTFDHNPLTLTLNQIIQNIRPMRSEPQGIPFPQADDIRKVRDTVDLISWRYNTRDQIAEFWDVEERQGDYYANAAYYLGLICRNTKGWMLTDKGKAFVHLPTTHRNKMLTESIFSHPVFYEIYIKYFEKNVHFSSEEICNIIQKHYKKRFAQSTLERRSKTILTWIANIINTYELQNKKSKV